MPNAPCWPLTAIVGHAHGIPDYQAQLTTLAGVACSPGSQRPHLPRHSDTLRPLLVPRLINLRVSSVACWVKARPATTWYRAQRPSHVATRLMVSHVPTLLPFDRSGTFRESIVATHVLDRRENELVDKLGIGWPLHFGGRGLADLL